MADPQEDPSCPPGEAPGLPDNPYLALNYHYGMLLGVDDLVTEQAYHRGKLRLHNAWLHGAGVVWGLGVAVDLPSGEIRVAPGLALDGRGRELHNDEVQCLHLGRWFAEHRKDPGFDYHEQNDLITFDAHVVVRHRACLARPVPAVLEGCGTAESTGTASSRIVETIELLLRPGVMKESPASPRFRKLRVLLGLALPPAQPGDEIAQKARQEILSAPDEHRLDLAAAELQRMAVYDCLEAKPGSDPDDPEAGLFPAGAPTELVLADIKEIKLQKKGDALLLLSAKADNEVRPVLLAAELLATLAAGLAADPVPVALVGPRIKGVDIDKSEPNRLVLKLDRALDERSLSVEAFAASRFDDKAGWRELPVKDVSLNGKKTEITVVLSDDPPGSPLRLIARGTGPAPLMGENRLPLFGSVGSRPDNPAAADAGRDFVWMK